MRVRKRQTRTGPLERAIVEPVVTDPAPRQPELRRQFDSSDRQVELALPPAETLQAAAVALQEAMATEKAPAVRKAGVALLDVLATHYGVSRPGLSVLGLRPKEVYDGQFTYELFGDYTPTTQKIRVWMRTAVRGKVTSFRGLLNTIVHEFCHHLDIHELGFTETPHTRGFYARIDVLYHLALGTPAEARMPLVWRKRGPVFVADWVKMRAALKSTSRRQP